MTRTLDLVNQTKAKLSVAGSENVMTITAPSIGRQFAGLRAFISPLARPSTEPVEGTLSYEHEVQLTGPADATVEVVDDHVVANFRLVDGGKGLEDVVVATFKGDRLPSEMTTTVLQGSWGTY